MATERLTRRRHQGSCGFGFEPAPMGSTPPENHQIRAKMESHYQDEFRSVEAGANSMMGDLESDSKGHSAPTAPGVLYMEGSPGNHTNRSLRSFS